MIFRKTTKELLAESFKELLQKKSADKITVKEIAKNCGVTAPTFYNHFRDKYDLIAWIYSKPIEKLINNLNSDNYQLRDSVAEVVKYFLDNKVFLRNLAVNTSGQNSFINYVAQFHVKILSDYIKRSQNLKELPQDMMIHIKVYCYGTVCTLCELLIKPFQVSADELVKIFEEALPVPLKKYFYKNLER